MAQSLLEPVAAGQTRFRLHGLFVDARGVAVGREILAMEGDVLDHRLGDLLELSAQDVLLLRRVCRKIKYIKEIYLLDFVLNILK